jgi:hypothetical protein
MSAASTRYGLERKSGMVVELDLPILAMIKILAFES